MITELLSVCLAVVLAFVLLQVTSRRRRYGEPPLERGPLPYLGVALDFAKNPLRFIASRWRKYGDVFTVRLAGHYTTFVLDPHSFSHAIRQTRALDFREFSARVSHRAFGTPIFYGSPQDWIRADTDALFPKELQGEGLDRLTEVMMGNLQSAMLAATDVKSEWNTRGLWSFVYRVIFIASLQTLFGRHRVDPDETPRLLHAMEEFRQYDKRFPEIIANIPWWLLGQTKKRFEYLKSLVTPAELSQRDASDFIRIRQGIYAKGNLTSDETACCNFGTFWASLSNTIPAAFWTLYYLLKDADAMNAVRAEVDEVLKETGQSFKHVKDGVKIIHITRQQLNSMKYLGSAINEALRMCSASIVIRVATEDTELTLESGSTFRVRKGDRVALYPQFLHMDPEVFPDPETYKYDRFLENGKEKTTFFKNGRKLRYYLLPFGHGVSMCPGRFFALNEIKQFVAIVVCYFDMELLEKQTPPHDQSRAGLGTLPPLKECLFRYRAK